MLLQECPEIPGSLCDLKQCTPPNDQEDDACQKAHDYQRCLVEKIIDNNECALFEKGAAVSMLVMTGLRFPNCDEGEGHSWVEDDENAFYQATTVLLYLVESNSTETNGGPKNEDNFEHFGSELCDQELDNKKEWKAFGPEWIKDEKGKPRPEYVEPQESVQAERDGILSKSENTNRAGDVEMQHDFEQFGPDSDTTCEISKEEIKQFQRESDTACEINDDMTQFQPDSYTAGEIKEDLTYFQSDSDTADEIKEDITQFQPDCDTAGGIKDDITQCQRDSDTAGEIKEDLTQFQPDSDTAGEIKDDITQFQSDSDMTRETAQEEIKQYKPDSYRDW
ncbi:unnamed protein product [Lymnaea stagnalis]|uniref:Uncharacterized protein n=1 Tax=Lymnaea stagnalis TaxID=6523 RepID=A0AAV2HZC5_LYMST